MLTQQEVLLSGQWAKALLPVGIRMTRGLFSNKIMIGFGLRMINFVVNIFTVIREVKKYSIILTQLDITHFWVNQNKSCMVFLFTT